MPLCFSTRLPLCSERSEVRTDGLSWGVTRPVAWHASYGRVTAASVLCLLSARLGSFVFPVVHVLILLYFTVYIWGISVSPISRLPVWS